MESLKVLLILILCTRVTSDCDILLNNFPPYLIKDGSHASGKHSKGIQYEGLLEKGLHKLTAKCGRKCTNIKWIMNPNLNETLNMKDENTMLAFPIPVKDGEEIRQYFYKLNDSKVEVSKHQGESNWILIVDIKRCRAQLTNEIFQTIWKQSPILPIMLLVAAIAGIILWVLEAPHNAKEFSSSFLRGTFDGFWWAFISMTTVGYGDKTPRTMLGKVFGMVWITMGIVIISFFTATIASTITIATVEKSCHTLKNRNVAIISNDKDVKDYVKERNAKPTEFDNFSILFEAWKKNEKGGINSIFVEEHTALMYFNRQKKDDPAIVNLRVTKSTKDVKRRGRTTMFYTVLKNWNSSTGSTCGLNKGDLKDLLVSGLPKPDEMYKTGFEEEVDQPFSINSPETIPILEYLGICFGGLAISGYIGITVINCIKRRKKEPKLDILEGSSKEMKNIASAKRRTIQHSLALIAQEVKEINDVLDSTDA